MNTVFLIPLLLILFSCSSKPELVRGDIILNSNENLTYNHFNNKCSGWDDICEQLYYVTIHDEFRNDLFINYLSLEYGIEPEVEEKEDGRSVWYTYEFPEYIIQVRMNYLGYETARAVVLIRMDKE